jgi:hypothetical protein
VEPRADFEQARQTPVQRDPAPRRRGDPAEDLEQRALTRSVPADDAHRLAFADREADVAQGPETLALRGTAAESAETPQRSAKPVAHDVVERLPGLPLVADADRVFLPHTRGLNRVGRHQMMSAKRRSTRSK